MKKFLIGLGLVCSILSSGCGRKTQSEDEEGANVKATVAVKIIALHRGDMAAVVQAVGKVDALRKEKLLSPVAGRVISVKALEGTAVQASEVLAVIETKESQAAIAGAEALLRSANTEDQKSEAQKALALAESSRSSVMIRSTFGGTVSTRSISEGEFVAENEELFTVIDQSTLIFVADVPARNLPLLKTGGRASVELQTSPEKDFGASIEAINPQIDAMSQTLKVRLAFSGLSPAARHLLKTDMIGSVKIVTGLEKGVFIVPKAALLRNDETNTYSVVTFTSDSLALSVPVEVIGMTDSTVAITNHALKVGMGVITEGNYALADSTRITIVQ